MKVSVYQNRNFVPSASLQVSLSAASVVATSREPNRVRASFNTSLVHSLQGRPTRRMNLSVTGICVPSTKQESRRGCPAGDRSTFPSNNKLRFRKSSDVAVCRAFSNTAAFDTLEIKAGAIPTTLRRHLFWNPSNLLFSALVRQTLPSAYNSFDSTSEL